MYPPGGKPIGPYQQEIPPPRGAAVVAVLHDLNLAAGYADRLAVLRRGRLVAAGTVWDVLREGLLSEVFACPIAVGLHPVRGCPLVMPLGGTRSLAEDTPAGTRAPTAMAARPASIGAGDGG